MPPYLRILFPLALLTSLTALVASIGTWLAWYPLPSLTLHPKWKTISSILVRCANFSGKAPA